MRPRPPVRPEMATFTFLSPPAGARTTTWKDSYSPRAAQRAISCWPPAGSSRATRVSEGTAQTTGPDWARNRGATTNRAGDNTAKSQNPRHLRLYMDGVRKDGTRSLTGGITGTDRGLPVAAHVRCRCFTDVLPARLEVSFERQKRVIGGENKRCLRATSYKLRSSPPPLNRRTARAKPMSSRLSTWRAGAKRPDARPFWCIRITRWWTLGLARRSLFRTPRNSALS